MDRTGIRPIRCRHARAAARCWITPILNPVRRTRAASGDSRPVWATNVHVVTHDAGRACSDSGECEGACLADLSPTQESEVEKTGKLEVLGKCTARSPQFGCQAMVKEGFVTGVLCVD